MSYRTNSYDPDYVENEPTGTFESVPADVEVG